MEERKSEEEKVEQELEEATTKITHDSYFVSYPVQYDEFKNMSFDLFQHLPKIEIELER
jgi:hypothetical protein